MKQALNFKIKRANKKIVEKVGLLKWVRIYG
jgi:hypothetical protein